MVISHGMSSLWQTRKGRCRRTHCTMCFVALGVLAMVNQYLSSVGKKGDFRLCGKLLHLYPDTLKNYTLRYASRYVARELLKLRNNIRRAASEFLEQAPVYAEPRTSYSQVVGSGQCDACRTPMRRTRRKRRWFDRTMTRDNDEKVDCRLVWHSSRVQLCGYRGDQVGGASRSSRLGGGGHYLPW